MKIRWILKWHFCSRTLYWIKYFYEKDEFFQILSKTSVLQKILWMQTGQTFSFFFFFYFTEFQCLWERCIINMLHLNCTGMRDDNNMKYMSSYNTLFLLYSKFLHSFLTNLFINYYFYIWLSELSLKLMVNENHVNFLWLC